MKNTGIRAIAQQLQAQGRGRDKILAHIMPEEAAMLKRMGGRGTVNPATGLLEFDNPSMGAYDSPSSGGVSPGLSGFGGGSSSPGGVSSSGATNPSVGGGGGGGGSFYTSGGGRDSSSSNQSPSYTGGGGGGMLTAGTPTMVSSGGGSFTPMGGSSSNYLQSLGVPTIVANAASTVGQGLLNFSDWSTGQYRQMMGGLTPSTTFPSTPGFRSEAALEAAAAPRSNIDPVTGRDYGREAVQRSIAWGEALGGGIASLRDMLSAPQEVAPSTPGFRSEAASGGYDFTPDYTGTIRDAEAMRNQILSQQVGDMFGTTPVRQGDFGPTPQGFDVTAEDVTRQIMTPTGVTIQPTSSVPVEYGGQERGIMEQIMAAPPSPQLSAPSLPGFRSEAALESLTTPTTPGFRSEAALEAAAAPAAGMSLEGLPPGRLGTFDMQTAIQQYRQSLNNIQVPSGYGFNVTAGPYVNDPSQTNYYQTDAQIAQKIMGNLPLAGLQLGPDGQIQTAEGGIPSAEQMSRVATLAAQQYTVPQSKLPEGAVGQMTLDPRQFVDVRSVPMPPERPAEEPVYAGPPGFRSEVAQNVAQSLDAEFENLTKSASLIEGPQPSGLRSEILSEGYGYTAPAPTTRGITAPEQMTGNLPTFAQVPVGTPRAFPETPAAMQYEGQYQPPTPTDLPAFIEAAGINANSTPAQISGALANMSTDQIYNILDESERQRRTLESTTGPFKVRENAAVTRGVDPRLLDIARKESVSLPQGQYYEFTSGVRPGDTGVHSTGRALDVAIMTPDGQRLPNYQNPVFFSNYEQPALVGRGIQQQIYPELASNYYWGGYFSGPKGVYGALDVMDRRIGGNRPLGGSWETGLTEKQAALWGLPSGVTQVAQTKGVTSPEATQAAIQEGKLSNLLDYTFNGLRSEILGENYNAPQEPVTGYRDALRALGYTEEQIDKVEGVSNLPATTAAPSSANLLEEYPVFSSTGGGGRDTQPLRETAAQPPAEVPVEQTPSPVYTTGMNLARRTYTPRLPTETISPAYS